MQGSKQRWKYGRAVLCLGREEKISIFFSIKLLSICFKTYATMKYPLKGGHLPNLR